MSIKDLDLSDPSKLSQDELRYARDRYLIDEDTFLQYSDAPAPSQDGGDEPEPEAEVMGPGKDPADFKVAEVVAYLQGLDTENNEADAEEFDRVIEAEVEGEERKTILKLAEED